MRRNLTLFLVLLTSVSLTEAQIDTRPPERGGITKSLGQPPVYKWHLGFSIGSYQPGDNQALTTQFRAGVFKDLFSPVASLLGFTLEGYIGNRNVDPDGGFRGFIELPTLRLSGGIDYNARDGDNHFILRFNLPVRRSGIFGSGTALMFEWLPARGNSINLGIKVPLFQPNKGRTRPEKDYVMLTIPEVKPLSYENAEERLAEAIAHVHDAAHWINRFTTPYFDYPGADPYQAIGDRVRELKAHIASSDLLYPEGRTSEAETRLYHQELERAFSIAVSGKSLTFGESTPEGREVTATAKEIIVDEVIFPYNRLLGQRKREDTTLEFAALARGALARWLHTTSVVPEKRVTAVRYVFQELLDIIEANRESSRKTWKDSRLVWIPLQYAFLPEEHDTQEELDAIIERASGHEFTTGNHIWYVINEQFQYEVSRQIHLAEDYHVLWIHDIQAYDAGGQPDTLTFRQVLESYLAAMIRKVRQYDSTGTFPVYMIVIDQHYYELHHSRTWLKLLERPLDHEIKLADKSMENAIREAQERLREAVAESELLQAEAQQYGSAWLKNLIKVHINVTNPADLSYWSKDILPLIGIPDNIMRDHRKISFYDITEEDPYKGIAMYSGMGIGEHYVGPTWEDRGIMLEGPAALGLKYAARQLLLNQGFKDQEIPYPLQIKQKPSNYEEIIQDTIRARAEQGRGVGRVFETHNQTGFRYKPINVVKAVIYTLMPKGSIIKIPDSLWNGSFLASQLLGAALRGARVFIIAPSLPCAPGTGFPQMSRVQELFSRLIVIQDFLGEEIAAAGGILKTGMYDPEVDVADIPGHVRSFGASLERYDFLRELYGFSPAVYSVIDSVDRILEGFRAGYLSSDAAVRRPKLHLKANFFASPAGWEKLLGDPGFAEVFRVYIEQRAYQVSHRATDRNVRDQAEALREAALQWLQLFLEQSTPEQEKKIIYYLLVGSANQDYRSMMMDGEAMVVVAKWQSLYGLMDFIFMMGLCKWVDNLEELQKYLPSYNGFQRKIGRWLKNAL